MKHSNLKKSCLVLFLLVTTLCHAQLTLPFNIRTQHIRKIYELSPQQLQQYEIVLSDILNKWNEVKNKKCSPAERQAVEKNLQKELCRSVKQIFPDRQYYLWNTNHRGNLTVRFYKEDLGMSSEQFLKYRSLSQAYTTKKTEISHMKLLGIEQSERRNQAFKGYSDGLHEIFSKEIADYLIYENKVLNKAKTLSKKYTILSENKAIRYAILKLRYEEDLEKLKSQNLLPNQRRKSKKILQDNYEKSLLEFLTQDEYLACIKSRDKLTDAKFAKEYNLTNAQLMKYKELRKRLAMDELMIKQNKKNKAEKPAKLQAARDKFEKGMELLLGAEQYKRWKTNEQLKAHKGRKSSHK